MDKIKIYQKQDVEIIKNIKFLNLIFVYSILIILQFCKPFESHKFTKINKQKRIFIAKHELFKWTIHYLKKYHLIKNLNHSFYKENILLLFSNDGKNSGI